MCGGDTEADGRTVIEDILKETIKIHDLGQAVDDPGNVLEGAFEFIARRHGLLAEPRKIRRDDVKVVGKERNQIVEHVPGAREPVEQQRLGRLR